MKKINTISVFLILICFFNSCAAQKESGSVDFLVGTWKMEQKNTFEVWNKEGAELKGHSYKEKDGQKKILETLSIKEIEENLVYTALVPDQNQGNSISFTLNTAVIDKVSFENLAHDFPKKIQYKKIDATRIFVNVLGEDDQGFSYYLIKQ